MNPEMKKVVEEIQKANPGISEEDAIREATDYILDNLDEIILGLKLPGKRSDARRIADDLRLMRTKGGTLRKSEIRSTKYFVDDLNEIRERLLEKGHTTEADVISENITCIEESSIAKKAAIMDVDSTLTKAMGKLSREQKSSAETKTLLKDLQEDLDE